MEKIAEGADIYLRRMEWEDTDDIVKWRNTDSVRKNFIYQELFTPQSHRKWIETMIETGKAEQFIICLKDNGQAVGSVYIRDIDRIHNKGEYGIFIGEEAARGRGIGTEAAKLMIVYAFEQMKLHRLFLRVFAENQIAVGSYERAGFEREAFLKEDVLIDGVYRNMILMGIIKQEEVRE